MTQHPSPTPQPELAYVINTLLESSGRKPFTDWELTTVLPLVNGALRADTATPPPQFDEELYALIYERAKKFSIALNDPKESQYGTIDVNIPTAIVLRIRDTYEKRAEAVSATPPHEVKLSYDQAMKLMAPAHRESLESQISVLTALVTVLEGSLKHALNCADDSYPVMCNDCQFGYSLLARGAPPAGRAPQVKE